MQPRSIQLGFLSYIPNPYGPTSAARSLDDGIGLFEWAEQLGYDIGWVRVLHFEQFSSSPLTFLSAVGQRTSKIRLGIGVIPMRYEDPIRLAEDASTVDLLTNGRLELGVSSGLAQLAPILDRVFGEAELPFGVEAQSRFERLRSALAGEPVGHGGRGFITVPADSDLSVTPSAPGLAERVWYGPASLSSAIRAGEQGLDIHVSTLNVEKTTDRFSAGQAKQLRAYREAFAASDGNANRSPRIAAGRIILPFLSAADAEPYAEFVRAYNDRIDEEGRPKEGGAPMVLDRLHTGEPERIIDELLADEALAEATELTVSLPATGGIDAHRRTLELVAEHIAPALGWSVSR